MAKKIGQLVVDLRLRSQKFNDNLKKASGSLNKFRQSTQNATKSLGGAKAGIAALLGIGGFTALIGQSLRTADSLAKVSDRLGITTQALASLRFAAEQTGASQEALDMGLQRMVRRLGQVAATGKGEAAIALEQLGIAIEDIKNLAPEQQFAMIAEKMKGVATQGERVFITQKLFDSEGVKLLNTLNLGAEGLQGMISQANELGIAINRVEAAKIEAANDAINSARKAVQGLGQQATAELAPFIEEVAKAFVEYAKQGNSFRQTFRSVVEGVAVGVAYMKNAFNGLQGIWALLKVGVWGVAETWASAFDFIRNDVIVPFSNSIVSSITAPLKATLGFFAEYSDTAQSMLDKVNGFQFQQNDVFANFAETARANVESAIADVQSAADDIIPIEELRARIDEIFARAEENAVKVAESVKNTVVNISEDATDITNNEEKKPGKDDRDEDLEKEELYQNTLANLRKSGSKKIAAITKAAALKEAIVTGKAAIVKAWNMPFPLNLAAVPLVTAGVYSNIQAIRGQAHDGIDSIPREGTWLLDKGERVVDSRTNQDLKNFLRSGGDQQMQPSNVNISFPNAMYIDQKAVNSMAPMIEKALARNSRR